MFTTEKRKTKAGLIRIHDAISKETSVEINVHFNMQPHLAFGTENCIIPIISKLKSEFHNFFF